MKAYRVHLTISDPNQIVLSNVPFHAGEKVEIVVLSAEDDGRVNQTRMLKKLFAETQSLPQVQALTDDDILREVEAQRSTM